MKCIVCSSPISKFYIGKSPISGYRCKTSEESLKQPSFNMVLHYCESCNMIKYKDELGADKILNKLYSEHTATYYFTVQLTDYLNKLVDNLSREFNITERSTILEIGCNSGRLLSIFREKTNCHVLGIEPSKAFNEVWFAENIEVINDYFNERLARKLKTRKFDIIIFRHVFEHITDPINFIKGVAEICDISTVIVIEVPYFVTVLNNKRIENISYSHRNYFTIRSMNEIFRKFGMGITKVKLVETDGGSILFQIRKQAATEVSLLDRVFPYEIDNFIQSIQQHKELLKEKLKNYTKEEVVGYGAGAKGQHLIHMLGLEALIGMVVDDTPEYENTFIPGTQIKIQSIKMLRSKSIKAVVNLAPTHTTAIKEKVPEHMQFINVITN